MTMNDRPATTNDEDAAKAQVAPRLGLRPACTAKIDPWFPTLQTGDHLRLTKQFPGDLGVEGPDRNRGINGHARRRPPGPAGAAVRQPGLARFLMEAADEWERLAEA